jgi:hypothetical protein
MSVLAFASHAAEFGVAWAGKWLLAGRLAPGSYPLWGLTYFRWWLADRLVETVPVYLITGSALHPAWLRLLGARIGPGGAGLHHHARAAPGQHWRGRQHRQRRKSGERPRRRRPAAPGPPSTSAPTPA